MADTTDKVKTTIAIVLPKKLVDDILAKKTDKLQTTTDCLKMALIRQFKLNATDYPAGSKGKARKDYSPKQLAEVNALMIAALTAGNVDDAKKHNAEMTRMIGVNANIEAAKKAKLAKKASEIKVKKAADAAVA